MSIRKIGTGVLSIFLSLGLVACAQNEPVKEPVKLLVPTGAPALSVLGAFDEENVQVDTVNGTDILMSELAKKDSEYDMIVAPTNLGVKIYEKTQAFSLASVLTWGNLYMVGDPNSTIETASIAAFGQQAVPELVLNQVYDTANMNITYYNSVQEAQQALLTGKSEVSLLAQPIAAATIAKAKEMNKELTVLSNLQTLWQEKTGSETLGYPQASLFIKTGSQEKVNYVLDEIADFLEDVEPEDIEETIEEVGVETLGIPNAQLAVKTWEAQNIRYVKASQAKTEIESFLKLFQMECPKDIFVD